MALDYDLIFVLGVVIAAFAVPALVSALVNKRLPKLGVLLLVLGGGMAGFAMQQVPDAYSFETLDDVAVSVLGRYLN